MTIIDKTRYIEKLENLNESFVIFLRPRRFKKSLFPLTLQYYYDENSAHEFDNMFNDTYIGKNPTPLKNSYRILFLESSRIEVEKGLEFVYDRFSFKIQLSAVS